MDNIPDTSSSYKQYNSIIQKRNSVSKSSMCFFLQWSMTIIWFYYILFLWMVWSKDTCILFCTHKLSQYHLLHSPFYPQTFKFYFFIFYFQETLVLCLHLYAENGYKIHFLLLRRSWKPSYHSMWLKRKTHVKNPQQYLLFL